MLVSSSSSALTGPGFFLAGTPAAAGCGEGGAACSEEDGFILTPPPPPSGSGNIGAEAEHCGGPDLAENRELVRDILNICSHDVQGDSSSPSPGLG